MPIIIPLVAADGAKSTVTLPDPPVAATEGSIIPATRTTLWQPGVTYNGGIPNRTTIYKTLSPLGGSKDDTPQIQAVLDSCPANQVVQLTAGVFNINGNGLRLQTSNITFRGVGAGKGLGTGKGSTFVPDSTATQLVKADRASNTLYEIMTVGNDPTIFSTSINITVDAAAGTNSIQLASNPGITVGEIVLVDQVTNNHPDVFWGLAHDPAGGGSRRWFMRQDRSLSQILEVKSISGNTVTFATPLHCTFQVTYKAQLSRYSQTVSKSIGIENMQFFGGCGGDWHGNVAMSLCSYSWFKGVEAAWSVGTSIGLYGCYRCEVRDSYIHESADPNPGGGGYLLGMTFSTSDCLFENNISWNGNKQIVMRATGGGNVIAYNYMDDSYGSGYPSLGEAGVNAGHYTTPHMELIEGNYSQNYKGDAFWGNSIDITVFRNHLSAIRVAHPPLNTYKDGVYPYMDLQNRRAVDIQAHSYRTNLVGNILGKSGQVLLTYSSSGYSYAQAGFVYESLSGEPADTLVEMWFMGEQQNPAGNVWVATTYQTQLRDGNWDWVNKTQTWHGIGGAADSGTPKTIPNSLYLTSAPAFFGSNPWPWVNPATGSTSTLPAKARFDAGTPNG